MAGHIVWASGIDNRPARRRGEVRCLRMENRIRDGDEDGSGLCRGVGTHDPTMKYASHADKGPPQNLWITPTRCREAAEIVDKAPLNAPELRSQSESDALQTLKRDGPRYRGGCAGRQ